MLGDVELVLDAKADLGEGPSWDAANNRLLWVDILGKAVHMYYPQTGNDEAISVLHYVGAVVPRAGGGVALVTERGFEVLNLETRELTPIADPETDKPGNRFNDGKCDSQGRFWAGTMNLGEAQTYTGSLYCLSPDGRCEVKVRPVTCSNGLAWSPDNRTMYYVDSPTKQVVAFDFDVTTGDIRNGRVVVAIPDGEGVPDGMSIDADGMLWVAQWDGWKVSRWNPHTGERLETIDMPVARPTSCCFGGPDLTDLYITSSRADFDEASLAKQPLAGGLFRVRTNVQGAETFAFRG